MARNKHPEQTVEQILAVAERLFIGRGYDKTTIQNIIDELGLSKGAIYHHFKSKEEILEAIITAKAERERALMRLLIESTQGGNAKEKIRKLLALHFTGSTVIYDGSMSDMLSSQIKDPRFVAAGLKACVQEDAPVIAELFQNGIGDGSIQTDYPLEYAEIFMLLVSIWSKPVLFSRNKEQTKRRLSALQALMKGVGVDILSDEAIKRLIEFYDEVGFYQA